MEILVELGEGRDLDIEASGPLVNDYSKQDLSVEEDNNCDWLDDDDNNNEAFMPGNASDSSVLSEEYGDPSTRLKRALFKAGPAPLTATERIGAVSKGAPGPLTIKLPALHSMKQKGNVYDHHSDLESDESEHEVDNPVKRQHTSNPKQDIRALSHALSSPWPSPLRPLPRSSHRVADSPHVQSQPARRARELSSDIMKELEDDAADEAKYWDADTPVCPQMDCQDLIPAHPEAALVALLNRRRRVLTHTDDGNLMDLNTQICDLVDYEAHQLPKAQANGWPLKFDACRLSKRVMLFKPHLQAVLRTPEDAFMWRALDSGTGGSKIKYLAGLYGRRPNDRALMATFQKIRVGYFGEEGEAVISSTLDVMFPSSSLRDVAQLQSINPESFKRLILVPECALYLIAQDRKLKVLADAFQVMCDSSSYGYHRFPFDGEIPIAGELSIVQMVLRDNRRTMAASQRPAASIEPLAGTSASAERSDADAQLTKALPKPRTAPRGIQVEQLESEVLDEDDLDETASFSA
ncbi:hypothetical protein BN946_scf184855.g5 [Trametes cinnabarina]|uniref:Restriction of telomere capping protein 4 n=1 Tax=Pycnoporus cinnabarinus TaxID=5643 RepID=A0A060SLL5_PYCCI|nr:hypothetical protein BN946_scf184855.g5 [Trametes cinnabarina]